MKKKYKTTALIALFLPSTIQSQQLTLDNAIEIAQENSLDAQSARF